MPYLTPNIMPSGTFCRTVLIPDDLDWLLIVNGALSELCDPVNFEQFGSVTPDEAAERFRQMFFEFRDSECASVTPIGAILDWMTDTPPAGWLICDGQSVSRTTYADLFSLWGDTFGAGDGSTTFNLPDFRFRSPIGAGSNLDETVAIGVGGQYGTETATLNEAELPPHSHPVADTGHNHGIVDPGHFHDHIRPGGAAGGAYQNVQGVTATNPVNVAWPTQSKTTGISVSDSTTGITIGSAGDGLPFSIIHPVLGVQRIVYAGV